MVPKRNSPSISSPFLVGLVALVLAVFGSVLLHGVWAFASGFIYVAYDTALLIFVTYKIRQILKHPRRSRSESLPMLRLGVVIAARNEASVLPTCLDALARQTEAPDEIHVIDDGSTDGTRSLLEQRRDLKITIWSKKRSGKADSLNQVWPKIHTEIIVTIDADTILDPEALAEMRLAFSQDLNLAAAGGVLTPRCHARGIQGRLFEVFQGFEYIRAFLSRRSWMEIDALLLVSGAFAAYRKDALIKAGGYNSESWVEDYELIHRIHRYAFERGEKFKVQVLIGARAETDAPGNLRAFLKQRQRWFGGFLQTQFKNQDMVGNSRYGNVGRIMLPVKALDTLQPLYGIVAFLSLGGLLLRTTPVHPFIWIFLGVKISLDLVFHFWSVAIYHRWRGEKVGVKRWALSAFATAFEPVSFQLLRHFGACLGWLAWLRGKNDWTPQRLNLPQNPV